MPQEAENDNFSEYLLIQQTNSADFDSAIPRFESWRPSQYFNGLPHLNLLADLAGYHLGITNYYRSEIAMLEMEAISH